jgi:acetoin utilization deacetylase AcuC-like enzyme
VAPKPDGFESTQHPNRDQHRYRHRTRSEKRNLPSQAYGYHGPESGTKCAAKTAVRDKPLPSDLEGGLASVLHEMPSFAFDPLCLEHNPGPDHPENPGRLAAIEARLDLKNGAGGMVRIPGRDATFQELAAVHTETYLARLEKARGHIQSLDGDTHTSEGSVAAARRAAGTTIDLAKAVARGEAPPGLALVRPPGHHATAEKAQGFCLLNNIAITAKALIHAGLAERVAIYDWDVHHGNGTQDIFYRDPNVLYLSTHQWPFYPGTGARTEEGDGPGMGTTVNIPVRAGTQGRDLVEATRTILLEKAHAFAPDIVLISAGFDALTEDPLGGLEATVADFRELALWWREFADRETNGRICGVLEGGYDHQATAEAVEAVLRAWE